MFFVNLPSALHSCEFLTRFWTVGEPSSDTEMSNTLLFLIQDQF